MKALTIKQPWAYLIASGIKDIENRTWPTKYRGKIFIHAGASSAGILPWILSTQQSNFITCNVEKMPPKEMVFSAIIGEVDIVDCVTHHPSIWAEVNIGGGKPICNWVLSNPILYPEPILNIKGKLSFWEPTKEQLKK